MTDNVISLRYGMNPHQAPARVYAAGELPLRVVNGTPGYINFLDALNAWQLVRELKAALSRPAAASFKHVSPAGAAVAEPLSPAEAAAAAVADLELSPLATAYARARGADRMSSFGDWVALSDIVDEATARLISREVSDGVIAPGYEPAALAILQKKKKGGYRMLQIDPDYEPPAEEKREVFGITLAQPRNDRPVTPDLLRNVVTKAALPEAAQRDLLVAYITLKYTQSNSICFAYNGQAIGVGAGQQSRIHCTRLAAAKAAIWYLRQQPRVLDLPFKASLNRAGRDNAIDLFLLPGWTHEQEGLLAEALDHLPAPLSAAERADWLAGLQGVALGSDGFIPFRDNIDEAAQAGVKYLIQPGGSVRDDDVIAACDEYGMAMVFTDLRLFHH